MSTEWIKHMRLGWPEGSLERQLILNYPGCKSLQEAVKQAIKDSRELAELKAKLETPGGVVTNPPPEDEW